MRSEASKQKEQDHAEAKASEEARCSQTRTFKANTGVSAYGDTVEVWTTNDVPGCPNGGLLSGTDGKDLLDGKDGDDEIHGLGGEDDIVGGDGNDVIYGGPGDEGYLAGDRGDDVINGGPGDDYGLFGDRGDDVIYGGDGEEQLAGAAGEDVLYGGNGNDKLDGLDHSIGSPVGPTVRDELYCGPGKDKYAADRLDYVDSSCEEKEKEIFGGGGIA